jgi:tricorn protease
MWLLPVLFAPLLLQDPSLSESSIAFSWGGTVWTVPREGGAARQITTGGRESHPAFSPDGATIAFSGEYDGNVDVFVVPASGGSPRRLTWHPGADQVVGWTRDGKSVLFRSGRDAYADFGRLFTVPVDGGFPEALPMWRAEDGAFSPDGSRIAYVPNMKWQEAWKRYRGGQTTGVQIARLSDLALTKVPREGSNDSNPMWVGDTVYFLSDRNGPVSLFAFDTRTSEVRQVVANQGFDLKSAAAGPGAIVYEQFASLHLFDVASGASREVQVEVAGDVPATRPHYEKVADEIRASAISPSGVRAAFEARGEILTVPAEKGDIRNITSSPAVADRDPAWSADGQSVAYFSDESGEYQLHIRSQSGLGEVRKIDLGSPPSFFYSPLWSPDGKKIAFTDKRRTLWYVDVEKGVPVKVDSDRYEDIFRGIDPSWSPDSRFIAYTMQLENHMRSVFVYSLEAGKTTRLTDGMSDARFPVFDAKGELLYFTASTDYGLSVGWLDLSSFERPVRRNLYVAVLRKDLPSPLAPRSDEEDPQAKKSEEDEETDEKSHAAPPAVAIDFEGIDQRILAVPVPAANYVGLRAGKPGEIFLLEQALIPPPDESKPKLTIHRFRLEDRETEAILEEVTAFDPSSNGEKMLYELEGQWYLAGIEDPEDAEPRELAVEAMEVYVDPRAEWRQMFRETWRTERDFLYDPGFHGLDLQAASEKYEGFLERVSSREDLNYLFTEMLGELTLGHVFVEGGDLPDAPQVKGGLLGADYKVEHGRYRFARVFNGESWNPNLRAPLTQPGVNVTAGEYLLEVNGRDVRPPSSVYAFFENTADRQVRLKVGPSPDGAGAREVTVVPVENEASLRRQAWIEDNRRLVDRLSGGRLAYVHLPDTATGGYTSFNRYFFAQIDKEGAILDERYNHGGAIADYVIDLLKRPLRACMTTRDGEDYCSPTAAIYGPKTMVINEMAGSGGDALPWMFQREKIGPLVGKRTWGGLVGVYDYPPLIDGGSVTAPRIAIYGLHGDWEVENVGIAPDVEVENDPASVAAGRDPQLEKAVEITLEALKNQPFVMPRRPGYPNYHPTSGNP